MSAEELVALYDPGDDVGRVVGVAPRSRMRRENLPHAATAVLLYRTDGRLLVHRRADTKDIWPGRHDCAAGGVVQAGEDPHTSAVRELAEELGVHGVRLHPLLRLWYRDDDAHYLAHVYRAVWDGEVAFSDGEVSAAWWETPDRFRARLSDPDWPFVPDTREILRRLDLSE